MLNPFELLNNIRRKDANPFRELSRAERLAQKQKEIEVQEDIKRMGLLCQDILSDQRYAEFAGIFKRIEQQLLDLMINCDEENRDVFYLRMKIYQVKLRMFKQILRVPGEFIEEAKKIERVEVK